MISLQGNYVSLLLSCQGSNLNSSAPEADMLPVTPQDNETAKVQKQILNKKKISNFLLLHENKVIRSYGTVEGKNRITYRERKNKKA